MSNVRNADEAIRRLEEMEAQWSGKKADPSAEAKKQAAAYNAAFWETMHTGMPQNSLKVGSDGAGGYLVPDTYEETLVQALAEKNVFRQIAKTIPTTHRMHIPVASGAGCADWFREDEGLSFVEESFGEVILDAYKLSASILATDEMLEDSAIDLEEHIRTFFAERIGEAEEEAFVRGNGKGKPLGLIYQAPMGAISELEGDITLDDILNLEYSVKQAYRDNAVWLMSEDAYHKLRRIPHYDGRPLWNPNLKEGEPEYLFGHRIYICKSMDDVAPGSIPVMFGDFRFFWIGDRGKRVIKRLVERYADRGQVAFITTERVDAKLVLPDAVKYLKINGKAQAAAEE
jgi:HK97 family phage major capsid protein